MFCLVCMAAHADFGPKVIKTDGHLVLYENGVIKDTVTSLEWLLAPDADANWHEAARWAEFLSKDRKRWRMPTRDELQSLYQKGMGKHNISPLFKITAWTVWTRELKGSSSAWCFNFDTGSSTWAARNRHPRKRAFAVRSPKPEP